MRITTEKELRGLLREAEAELDATRRSNLNAAAKKSMQAKAELKVAERGTGGATRRAASREAAKAGAS
jgi:hypothetical protein